MNNQTNAVHLSPSPQDTTFDEDEISLYDIVSPLLEQWKIILVATVLGVLTGFLGWWSTGYSVELRAIPVAPLNFVEWRRISSGLPALAEERRNRSDNDPIKAGLYGALSQTEWWSKNVSPQYRYSKNDLKELVGISRDAQETGATTIETVSFRAKSRNRMEAILFVRSTEEFVREGGLLLALKSMISGYNLKENNISAELRAKMSKEILDLTYLNKRASGLEALIQKYPEKSGASNHTVLDPKDNSSKYLPLGTQLIAVKTEIRAIEESLDRSRDLLEESQVNRAFLGKVLPLIKTETNGFDLSEKIDVISAEIRSGIDPENKPKAVAIDRIIFEFRSIRERYRTLFEDITLISTTRASKALPMAIGLIGGLLSGVLLVSVGTMWRRAKRERSDLTRVEG